MSKHSTTVTVTGVEILIGLGPDRLTIITSLPAAPGLEPQPTQEFDATISVGCAVAYAKRHFPHIKPKIRRLERIPYKFSDNK
jgi:hypothetical protein